VEPLDPKRLRILQRSTNGILPQLWAGDSTDSCRRVSGGRSIRGSRAVGSLTSLVKRPRPREVLVLDLRPSAAYLRRGRGRCAKGQSS